jgi:hypothetical protein
MPTIITIAGAPIAVGRLVRSTRTAPTVVTPVTSVGTVTVSTSQLVRGHRVKMTDGTRWTVTKVSSVQGGRVADLKNGTRRTKVEVLTPHLAVNVWTLS